jgi:NAD(P)-dependent dehydrogenase (short-subunit alcohol dehydrogenase family)
LPTIVVTGAGRGLGLELARQYAQDGWRVIGTVRNSAPALTEAGAETLTVDVTNTAEVKDLSLKLKGVPIDVLFCNAGIIGKRGMALGSFDYAEWEKVLRVNLLGAAALNLLAAALAATLAPRGVIVAALSPGWVKTDMGGESAPLTPQASVRGLRKVLAGLRREDSGKFFSHDGSSIPW